MGDNMYEIFFVNQKYVVFLLLKDLLNFVTLGKCLSINIMKIFATFVATLMLKKGGLSQANFRFLVFFFRCFFLVDVASNGGFGLYPFFSMVSVHGGHASLNVLAFLELVDRHLLMLFGRLLCL